MNELKFQVSTFVLVGLLAFGGYWAFTHLDSGMTYDQTGQIANETTNGNEPVVVAQNNDNQEQVGTDAVQEVTAPEPTTPEPTPSEQTKPLPENLSSLQQRLNNLIDDNINMRVGSFGTRVGTVQEFLNWYLEDDIAVDNSYGEQTRSQVRSFQQAEGLSADGLAGPNTYRQMLEVLGA